MPVGSPRPDTRTGYPDWTRDENDIASYISYANKEDAPAESEPDERKCRMSWYMTIFCVGLVILTGALVLCKIGGLL